MRSLPQLLALSIVAAVGAASAASPALAAPPSSSTNWTAAHKLSGRHYIADPKLAIDGAGAGIAVWQQPRAVGVGRVGYVATRDAGGAWSAARCLTVAGRSSDAIFAGIGGRGRDVAVWVAEPTNGGTKHLLWAQRRPGHAWTAPVRVPGQTVVPETFFFSSSGWGVIAYENHGVGYVRVLTPRGKWKPDARVTQLVPKVHHDAVGTHLNLRAVISSTGAVTTSWVTITVDTRSRTSGDYQRGGLSATGTRLAPVTVAKNLSAYGSTPSLTASASGDSTALNWDNASNHETVAFRLAGGSWQRHVAPIDNGLSAPATSAVKVALSDHRLTLWWQSWTDTVATLYQARYDGSSWGEPSAIAHYDDTGPTSLAEYGALSDQLEVLGWTQFQVVSPEGHHDSYVRTTTATGSDDLTLRSKSVIRGVAAAGRHAAVVWTGNGGLFVQTR